VLAIEFLYNALPSNYGYT